MLEDVPESQSIDRTRSQFPGVYVPNGETESRDDSANRRHRLCRSFYSEPLPRLSGLPEYAVKGTTE